MGVSLMLRVIFPRYVSFGSTKEIPEVYFGAEMDAWRGALQRRPASTRRLRYQAATMVPKDDIFPEVVKKRL